MKTKFISIIFSLFFISVNITTAQISQVKEINPTGSAKPSAGYVYNNAFYFSADDGVNGDELWKSDGTANGTVMVKDIIPGCDSASPAYFIEFSGALYFLALTPTLNLDLWKTTGVAQSTELLEASNSTRSIALFHSLFTFDDKLYFRAYTTNGSQIWSTPGRIPNSAVNVSNFISANINPRLMDNPIITGNNVFLGVDTGNGVEPHVFNGNIFTELSDINADGPDSFNTSNFGMDGFFFFTAYNGTNFKPYVSNGRPIGTKRILENVNIPNDLSTLNFVEFEGSAYFSANINNTQSTLWKATNILGSLQTEEVHQFPLFFSNSSIIIRMFATDQAIYISSGTETHINALWKYDGTTMTLLKTMGSFNNGLGFPDFFVQIGDYVFFSAVDNSDKRRLWVTDGTPEGTVTVASKFTNSLNPEEVRHLYNLNGSLIFTGELIEDDKELFILNPQSLSNEDFSQNKNLFSVYPNPSKGHLSISTPLNGLINYSISDLNGRRIKSGIANNNTIQHNLPSGIYVLNLKNDDKTANKKIIIK